VKRCHTGERSSIGLKNMDRLEATRHAGEINRMAIELGFSHAVPGTTLLEINDAIEQHFAIFGCVPIFKGYRGFTGVCCLSPNDVIVHGVPNNYVLKDGDLLTVDVGCSYEGWCVDSARTRIVSDVTHPTFFPFQERLITAVESVLEAEISVLKDGVSLLEIAKIAEARATALGVNICLAWGGHKIGRTLHEVPFIPNGIDRSLSKIKQWQLEREYAAYKFKTGDIICLEPVVTFGSTEFVIGDDGWTARSKDGSLVAHSERCLLVLDSGHEVIS